MPASNGLNEKEVHDMQIMSLRGMGFLSAGHHVLVALERKIEHHLREVARAAQENGRVIFD